MPGGRLSADTNVLAGCRVVGALNTVQAGDQLRIIARGNPDLKPEESDNLTLGMTHAPGWVDNLA